MITTACDSCGRDLCALSACATPARMHTEAQLNDVALGCGLALGELIQDESEKKLLLTDPPGPTLPSSASASPNGRAATASRPCSSTCNFPEG